MELVYQIRYTMQIMHFDLETFVRTAGYIGTFLIIFAETGFVFTPFLPGDSLLFAAGAMAAIMPESLNIFVLLITLSAAAILGDTLNYWIGHWIGPKAFNGKIKFLKKEYLEKTHEFFHKYGGKTIILARFVPIVRTFAPFVAGAGTMHYPRFLMFNIIGGILWVSIFTLLGYFFGNIPFIKKNFELAVVAIIVLSLLPMVYEFVSHKIKQRKEKSKQKST